MSFVRLAGTVVLALVSAAPALAEYVGEGWVAYDQGDYATALRLWNPLAEGGDPLAEFALGLLYTRGQAVPKDDAMAMVWYRRAADQGYAEAQLVVGRMYSLGEGMSTLYSAGRDPPRNDVAAYMWCNLAAASGNSPEAANLRDELSHRMTPEQIAEAQRLSREWKPRRPER